MYLEYIIAKNIAAVGYNKSTHILCIRLKRASATYNYYNVPSEIYAQLMDSPDKNEYFKQNIRNCYKYEKIN